MSSMNFDKPEGRVQPQETFETIFFPINGFKNVQQENA